MLLRLREHSPLHCVIMYADMTGNCRQMAKRHHAECLAETHIRLGDESRTLGLVVSLSHHLLHDRNL